jgi:two-component system C4-dicarboxylate transport sensor histidine kinase DctB
VVAAIYFLAIMFMSIRSVLIWDQSMLTWFTSKEEKPGLPSVRVPLTRLFPGSRLLTDQSHEIAGNFARQTEKQRQLANKNAKLSDRLQKTVTELVDSREEFARSSQLAAVGKVAGSVSHEINNPVTGVLGYLAFIKKRSTDESLVVWIDKAIKEVERIGRIARSLLVFSRHSATMAPAAFDVGPVIDNVVTLVGPQMREAEVEVVVDPITALPQAIGRVDELQQCLLNVLLNARYALLEQPQKKIWIEMNKAGDSIEISIKDSGTGIPAKVQEHLFQPFYTTKPAGQGSGLGLAVAHELMTGMGGSIRFDKAYAPGARFVLSIPLYDAKKAAQLAKAAEAAAATAAAETAKSETASDKA